jgi:threonine/homoserine/homoserine lactone efflux protein
MNTLLLAATEVRYPFVHGFATVCGVIIAIVLLIILIELILMIPDFIKTIKIHRM